MVHISDIKKFTRCPKMYWNSIHLASEPAVSYIRMDEMISDLVIEKLHITDYFLGERNDDPDKAMSATKTFEWLVKARFCYDDIRIKVPLMHKVKDKWDIYFIAVSVHPKDDDIQYYSYTVWVLKQLGFEINEIYIVHFNKDYVREDELDVEQLFVVNDTFYNSKGNLSKNSTKTILSKEVDLTGVAKSMSEIAQLENMNPEKTKKCVRKFKCKYYDICFKGEEELADDSIMSLVSSQHKNTLYNKGVLSLKDAPLEMIEGTIQQYAQIMASRNNGLFVDKIALKNWFKNSLQYPYSFLDFEWETYAIPPYSKLRSFDVVPFAYSLHTLDEEHKLEHKAFMGVHDCRLDFIQGLLRDLPASGSIIAYNGDGAEKIRLMELTKQFPEYKEQLENLASRIVDLSIPFMRGMVYDIRMRGYYSLKVLHSLLSQDHTYKDLEIHHGMDAVFKWRSLDKNECDDDEVKQQLMEYCTLDTYAMVVVTKWLHDLCQEENNENL